MCCNGGERTGAVSFEGSGVAKIEMHLLIGNFLQSRTVGARIERTGFSKNGILETSLRRAATDGKSTVSVLREDCRSAVSFLPLLRWRLPKNCILGVLNQRRNLISTTFAKEGCQH